jgi:hypothetical protein
MTAALTAISADRSPLSPALQDSQIPLRHSDNLHFFESFSHAKRLPEIVRLNGSDHPF